MSHQIGEFDQGEVIGSDVFRSSVIGDLLKFDLHTVADGFIGNLWGVSRALFLSILFFGMLGILGYEVPGLPLFASEWMLGTAPIWLPIAAIVVAWKAWVWYVKSRYIASIDKVLLEVKMPREQVRSPRAMEAALSQIWTDSGLTTFLNRVWQGHVHPYFSLEIASFGGDVHFYIWTWRSWRTLVESAMYAHYPDIEIVEAEDYASKYLYDPDVNDIWPTDWRYEPRNDAYPLKSYVDFELDKDPKEEYRVDPIAIVLEQMSNLRSDEQIWLQIIVTECLDKMHKPGGKWWETTSRYSYTLTHEIDEIRRKEAGNNTEADSWRTRVRIPQARQTELIRTIDRHLGKLPFNVGVRGVYICPPGKLTAGSYTRMRWIWRPYGNPTIANHLRPRRWANPFDYAWQDYGDIRWNLMVRRFFDAYRRRGYFYSPWIIPHNMMSTETIATLWHPPSSGIVAPGMERIMAKKAEPPVNLPT